jgi:hypothetical protein
MIICRLLVLPRQHLISLLLAQFLVPHCLKPFITLNGRLLAQTSKRILCRCQRVPPGGYAPTLSVSSCTSARISLYQGRPIQYQKSERTTRVCNRGPDKIKLAELKHLQQVDSFQILKVSVFIHLSSVLLSSIWNVVHPAGQSHSFYTSKGMPHWPRVTWQKNVVGGLTD